MKAELGINPTHELKYEISCIKSDICKEVLLRALQFVPDYFWIVPASSSGKHHPRSSLGIGGLLRHTKSVFKISEELLSHPLYAPFTDEEKDEIRVAILLHDACKQGTAQAAGKTLKEHPKLVRKALAPWNDEHPVDDNIIQSWDRICSLIETHMGIWTKDDNGNDILDTPKTQMQQFVHMCDYLSSRSCIEVDITAREEQYRTPEQAQNAWRESIATLGQINFIKQLYLDCQKRSIYVAPVQLTDAKGEIVLKRGDAHDLIDNIKKLLGK